MYALRSPWNLVNATRHLSWTPAADVSTREKVKGEVEVRIDVVFGFTWITPGECQDVRIGTHLGTHGRRRELRSLQEET